MSDEGTWPPWPSSLSTHHSSLIGPSTEEGSMTGDRERSTFTRRSFLAAMGVYAGGAILTACGGTPATTAPAAPTTAPTVAPTRPATTAATTAPAAGSPAGGAAGGAATPTRAGSPAAQASPSAATGGGGGGTMTGGFDVGPGGNPQGFNVMTAGAGYMWMEKY